MKKGSKKKSDDFMAEKNNGVTDYQESMIHERPEPETEAPTSRPEPEKKERKDREKERLIRDNEALKIENEKLRKTLAREVQNKRVSEVPGTGTPVSCIDETGGDPIAITKAERG